LDWINMLMTISGISEEKAISIAKVYKNLGALMEVYEQLTKEECAELLKDIDVIDIF